jgi:spore protease
MQGIRTDLAQEAAEFCRKTGGLETLPGVEQTGYTLPACQVTEITITTDQAARQVGKPKGRYLTADLLSLRDHEPTRLRQASEGVAHCLKQLLAVYEPSSILVAGLGNRDITPDAIGPWAVESVLVTRHMADQLPGVFRPVSAVAVGVLGTTGVETGELLRGVTDRVHPDLVIAVDALAARGIERLCTTVQLSDTGIVPGSGVGNARQALSEATLGVPVVALGVPTVVDGGTLAEDLTGQTLSPDDPARSLIVTPRDIDLRAMEAARVVGIGINLAVQNLSYEEVEGLLG